MDESWGSQPFQIQKGAGAYSFTHVFRDPARSDRFLRDVASSDSVALFFGPSLMMSLPLGASDAVAKLRECAAKVAEQQTSGELPN